jgi:hypothetical protein
LAAAVGFAALAAEAAASGGATGEAVAAAASDTRAEDEAAAAGSHRDADADTATDAAASLLDSASDTIAEALDDEPLEPGVDPEAQPLRVFAEIERAWARGDAESLLVHIGEGKVALSFTRSGPRGGLFTRTQTAYLLADLFKYSETEEFKFVKFRNIDRDGQLPFAVADRIFRLDNGILYRDQVYVSLRRERDAWKVAEIRSIDH